MQDRERIPGSKNTRDLGGIRTADGRSVKYRRLIRGDAPVALPPEAVDALANEYKVKKVIDLRTAAEVEERPDTPVPGAAFRHIPLFAEEVIGITRDSKSERESARGFVVPGPPDMKALYAFLVEGDVPREGMRRVAREIFSCTDGAVLFHCSVGKDRTGVVTMLLLGLLGVPYPAILDDYLYTNVWGEADAAHYRDIAFEATGDTEIAERTRRAFLAIGDYLDSAFSAVTRLGGFESYFINSLGFIRAELDAFRESILEG